MVSILSIDFDYFIDASSKERDTYFPTGSDEIPEDRLKSLWNESYMKYPNLKEIGVIDDFYYVKNLLSTWNKPKSKFYKADTHKYIKNIIDIIPCDEQIKVVNIDFHHDYYHYYTDGNSYNCGNWLRRLVEDRPDTKVKWIRRIDSQIDSLEGEFPFAHTSDIKSISNERFDYLFICKSPEWSPPHLSDKFEELVGVVSGTKTT